MTDDFPTPPPRSLPPEVRDHLRTKLNRDLADEHRRRLDRVRGPIAIAAGVAVLAAGAMIVAQSVNGASNDPTPGHPPSPTVSRSQLPVDLDKANAKLDRCFAAMQQAGKTAKFPPRAQWEPVYQTNYSSVNVTGAIAAGKVFFCETTNTEVIISDPDATPTPVPGSTMAALLQTRLNTFAGVADLSWRAPWLEFTGMGDRSAGPLGFREGLFIVQGGGKVAGPVRVAEDDPTRSSAQWKPLPQAPPPAVSIVDRPTNTPPDRISERGKQLDNCLRATNHTIGVPDVASWRPGAAWKGEGAWVVVTRNEFGSAVCWNVNGMDGFSDGWPTAPQGRPAVLGSTFEVPGGTILAGTVPAGTARMEVVGQLSIDLYDETFVLLLQHGIESNSQTKLYDANNRVIYQGRLMY